MAKPKKKPKKRGGGPAVSGPNAGNILDDLAKVADELDAADESQIGPLWGKLHRLLIKSPIENAQGAALIAHRDVDSVRAAIEALRHGEEAPSLDEAPPPDHDIPADELRKAMRAFRKRLKLTRLDEESRLSVSPLTGGKTSKIDAIVAPNDFPRTVWDALVQEGQLEAMGPGFYRLAEEA